MWIPSAQALSLLPPPIGQRTSRMKPSRLDLLNRPALRQVVECGGMNANELARVVMERIEALGRISEEPGRLTRTFCSPAMRQANDLVASWMRDAGMTVTEDAIGNLIGRYPGAHERAKTFILGSHLDTVRDAGKFDGPLGVLIAIACVQQLHDQKIRLPFAIEVAGFADEEGVRYQSTYLGSKVLAGAFKESDLKRIDANGVPMAEAIRSFGGKSRRFKKCAPRPAPIARLRGSAYRAGAGAGAVAPTGRRGFSHRRADAHPGALHRPGGPRGHVADGVAARRARGRGGIHRGGGNLRPCPTRIGRHRRPDRSPPRRKQRHPRRSHFERGRAACRGQPTPRRLCANCRTPRIKPAKNAASP